MSMAAIVNPAKPNTVSQAWSNDKVTVYLSIDTVRPLSAEALWKLRAVVTAVDEFIDAVQ
jgi:hypothetical protein